jgi:hypothetical protein
MKILFLFLFGFANLYSSSDSLSAEAAIKIIPGEEYHANKIHRYFFGTLWRDVWNTPVTLQLLDLNNFDGGLIPIEKGGGTQTASLKLKSKNGKEYRFRPLKKSLQSYVPEEAEDTFLEDLVNDQAASAFPYGAAIVSELQNALNILHAPPSLFIFPAMEDLNEFKEFSLLPGWLEEFPDDESEFTGAEKILNTFKLFERLETNFKERVASADYLKVRLLDIITGDWDRHTGQWRWALFESEGENIWVPIPRDRDQAFSIFNGVFPSITELIVKNLSGFTPDPNVDDLVYSGRFTDNKFLITLSKEDFDSVASYIRITLTDEVLLNAVKKMPEEIFPAAGEKIFSILKHRRDKIDEIASEFRRIIFRRIEINGTVNNDKAVINRLNDNELQVELFDKETGFLYFDHTYNKNETSEIILYLNEGDDEAIVSGESNSSIPVIIVGGGGKNLLIDSSIVRKKFLSLIPYHAVQTSFFYSSESDEIIKGKGTKVKKNPYPTPQTDEEKWEPDTKISGSEIEFEPLLRLSSEEGIFFGGGPTYYNYSFGFIPYKYSLSLTGGYSTKLKKFSFTTNYIQTGVFENAIFETGLKLSRLEVINFFGFGNNTGERDHLIDRNFYNVDQSQLIISPSIAFPLGTFTEKITAGVRVKHVSTPYNQSNLILNNSIFNENETLYQFLLSLTVDKRNFIAAPDSGYSFILTFLHNPFSQKENFTFSTMEGEARYYIPFSLIGRTSIALRAGGKKVFGNYPFYEAAFIGGEYAMRGEEKHRFAGDASIFLNADFRSYFSRRTFSLPVQTGILLLADIGRVFLKNEISNLWHFNYGGGFLFTALKRDYTVSVYIARSGNRNQYFLSTGFPF